MRGETVQRLRAATVTDPYTGRPSDELDWAGETSPVDELPIQTIAPAEPRPSTEPTQDARNAVVSGYTLYFAETPDVTSRDRIRVRGVIYQVLGDPAPWLDAGVVVQTGRVTG